MPCRESVDPMWVSDGPGPVLPACPMRVARQASRLGHHHPALFEFGEPLSSGLDNGGRWRDRDCGRATRGQQGAAGHVLDPDGLDQRPIGGVPLDEQRSLLATPRREEAATYDTPRTIVSRPADSHR